VEGGPSIDVVIVAYRSRELLRRCLESLDSYPPAFLRVVVVDNASHDGTVEIIRTAFPHVQLLESGGNVGFARATNAGIRIGHAPFVLALNPDTRVPPGVLEELLDVFAEHPDVGICGCRLAREDGSFDHASRREFPTVLSALGHFTGLGRHRLAPAPLAAYRAPDVREGVVDAVNGAFMLMRRAALDEVGLLDEGYWMYMEDLDLCYRFREAGWSTWYQPSVTVTHVKGGTSGSIRGPRLNYAFHHGMYRFYRTHYAKHRSFATNAAVYLGIVCKFAVSLIRSGTRRLLASGRSPRHLSLPGLRRLPRAVRTATPRHALVAQVRRLLGRSPPGRALKRRTRRPLERAARQHASRRERMERESDSTAGRTRRRLRNLDTSRETSDAGPIRNVLLISHCDFTGNSALHAYQIAAELQRRGYSPAIAVPGNPRSVRDLGRPSFPILTFRQVRNGRLRFDDGRGLDLIHAITPREGVRQLTVALARTHRRPYVVHLEDNESAVASAELGGATPEQLRALPEAMLTRAIGSRLSHPLRAPGFLDESAGVSVVVDRLLELAPRDIPNVVARPGFDKAVLEAESSRSDLRQLLEIGPEQIAIVYPGNVHESNVPDIRSLYEAVAFLRRDGVPVSLVKTGWNSVALPRELEVHVRDLGWVARKLIPELLGAADVLVQPGRPGSFNDYRFPAKLPEFLASGRPVVLPRANIGHDLVHERNALLLEEGDAAEIARTVGRLARDRELRERLGAGGQEFAKRELTWSRTVDSLEHLYRVVAARGRRPGSPEPGLATASDERDRGTIGP
jgi:GT2 family glycosyltransferase